MAAKSHSVAMDVSIVGGVSLSCFIPVAPVHKQAPQFSTDSRGNSHVRPGDKTAEYEAIMRRRFESVWKDLPPLPGSVMAEVWFYLDRPSSVAKRQPYPMTKPDLDNLEKALFDSMDFTYSSRNKAIAAVNKGIPAGRRVPKEENGRILENDSRIVSKFTHKRFTDTGSPHGVAGMSIRIRTMASVDKTIPSAFRTPILLVPMGVPDGDVQSLMARTMRSGFYPVLVPEGIDRPARESLIVEGASAFGGCCLAYGEGGQDDALAALSQEAFGRLGLPVFRLVA